MIQVRDVLQAKFGEIDQAVELFARPPSPLLGYMNPQFHFNVLTDISGDMYALINEFALPSLGEFERQRNRSFAERQSHDQPAASHSDQCSVVERKSQNHSDGNHNKQGDRGAGGHD
jgi:hypothetical protein